MNHIEMAHQLVAALLRDSPRRPRHKARTWARYEMVAAALPELERDYGKKNLTERRDRATERAAEWLNEHGDEMPPADYTDRNERFRL